MASSLTESRSMVDRIREREQQLRDQYVAHVNVGTNERWASGVVGGLMVVDGLRRATLGGLAEAILGGALAYRGYTGHCQGYEALGIDTAQGRSSKAGRHHRGTLIVRSFTIARSPEDCYGFWRNFENLPRFMTHLESVKTIDATRSHWVARAPLGQTVSWDAEILNETPNELIAWKSIPGSTINQAGSVRFRPAPGGRGTELTVELNYEPPGGQVGATIAWLFGEEPSWQIQEDLRRFKQLMEAGEIPTIEGQPSCRG